MKFALILQANFWEHPYTLTFQLTPYIDIFAQNGWIYKPVLFQLFPLYCLRFHVRHLKSLKLNFKPKSLTLEIPVQEKVEFRKNRKKSFNSIKGPW